MDDILNIIRSTTVCVFMQRGPSYLTASEVKFTKEQPYQMMDAVEAQSLIADIPSRFRLAEKDEVKEFFSKNKPVGPKRFEMV